MRVSNSLAASLCPRSTLRHTRTPTVWSVAYVWYSGAQVARSTWSWPLSVCSASTSAVRSRSYPSKNAPLIPSSPSNPSAHMSKISTILFRACSTCVSSRPQMILTRCHYFRYTFWWRIQSMVYLAHRIPQVIPHQRAHLHCNYRGDAMGSWIYWRADARKHGGVLHWIFRWLGGAAGCSSSVSLTCYYPEPVAFISVNWIPPGGTHIPPGCSCVAVHKGGQWTS